MPKPVKAPELSAVVDPKLKAAVDALHNGELVVYPTDTLWGLGCDPFDEDAVARLMQLKGRRKGGFSILVPSIDDLWWLAYRTPAAKRLAERFLPGPLTLVLRRRHAFPRAVTVGGTVGLRIPDHPVALALLRKAGPVIGTSANRHGDDVADSLTEVRAALGDGVHYLDGEPPAGIGSTIVDLTREAPALVRDGALPWSEVEAALAE